MESSVLLQVDGDIATVTMNRPEKMNALCTEVLEQLGGAIDTIAANRSVRAAILTGNGKAFVAGADIAEMSSMTDAQARSFGELGHRTFAAIEALRVPVIAAVNGFALGGGCELALACDFIYASDKAKFGQPEVGLGILPGFGGTQRLPRRVGIAMARELIYTGKIISAERAAQIGLANEVFAHETLIEEATKTAALIATNGPLAVSACKRVIFDGADRPLREANAIEVNAFSEGFGTADQKEGMAAFLQKRKAEFQGR
ncbi:MAG: enoyl-CoA hydratase-related protein [Polyangiales bacterium]